MNRLNMLITAALKNEVSGVVSKLHPTGAEPVGAGRLYLGGTSDRRTGILITGVGGQTASATVRSLLLNHQPRTVLVAGWSGALTETHPPGSLILADRVHLWPGDPDRSMPTDPELTLKIRSVLDGAGIPFGAGALVTADRMVDQSGLRKELAVRYGARAVDMETGSILPLFNAAGSRCAVLRVITDTADERIGLDLKHLPTGRKHRAVYLAAHPVQLRHYAMLLGQIRNATSVMSRALNAVIGSDPAPGLS